MERLLDAAQADATRAQHIFGDPGDIEKYWNGLRAADNNVFPKVAPRVDTKLDLALGLHGDSAPTHNTDVLLFYHRVEFPARHRLHRADSPRVRSGEEIRHHLGYSLGALGLHGMGHERNGRRQNPRA